MARVAPKRKVARKVITGIEYSVKQEIFYIFFADYSWKVFTETGLTVNAADLFVSSALDFKKGSTPISAVPLIENIDSLMNLTTVTHNKLAQLFSIKSAA